MAVLVEGENLGNGHAPVVRAIAKRHGRPDTQRVYGNMELLKGWSVEPGFRTVHSKTGKNSADMMLCLDAMEMALSGKYPSIMIVSSDSDFEHLAQRLRDYGLHVIGLGEAKAPEGFQIACSEFETLPPRVKHGRDALIDRVRRVVTDLSGPKEGAKVTDVSATMNQRHDFKISSTEARNWHSFFRHHSDHFDIDPRGTDARVRLKQAACDR
ncbi:NYN domain-containing protein [Jannaschia sp. S6380]|uniref:NYN domain-containing protein n=1 Tax=Jannaschia sp. S6380 TaxID=2926408 RepID=UPI001FF13334|nr:NYN domain-containing protein [Jannaschia sp. S6380]MCK0166869.1 NYN domain-containing protein [Jannaschia sp. S6380]